MRRSMFAGWPLVGWTSLVVGTLVAVVLWREGLTEDRLRVILRLTARTSLVLFLAAFLASALRRLVPSAATQWLLRNRRYVGVSFAVSHTVHGAAIVALTRAAGIEIDDVTIIAGGLGYVLLAAMTATSFDRTAAWLGGRWWKRLHTAGLFYLWGVFTLTYLGSAGRDLLAASSVVLLLAALGTRGMARWRKRSERLVGIAGP